MNDEATVKAGVECCSCLQCDKCPYRKYKYDFVGDCYSELSSDILRLMNEQLKNKE